MTKSVDKHVQDYCGSCTLRAKPMEEAKIVAPEKSGKDGKIDDSKKKSVNIEAKTQN